MPNHYIFNERPECQDRLIAFLQKMGYQYVSRSEAEQKRGSLSKVIFTDELIRFLNTQAMADDFRNGRMTKDYPVSIANDSDAKAFYGAVVTTVRSKSKINITDSIENTIADYSKRITKAVADNAKRDWKHNEVVHKQIHRALDDCLFDMFDEISVKIDNSNIEMLDIIIDEIMKVAVARY